VQVRGKTVLMDSSLYFLGVFLGFGEWLSHRLLYSSRGSREENPLSLLLFVIVMEALGRMISVANQVIYTIYKAYSYVLKVSRV
jgi:hypothetical protein